MPTSTASTVIDLYESEIISKGACWLGWKEGPSPSDQRHVGLHDGNGRDGREIVFRKACWLAKCSSSPDYRAVNLLDGDSRHTGEKDSEGTY